MTTATAARAENRIDLDLDFKIPGNAENIAAALAFQAGGDLAFFLESRSLGSGFRAYLAVMTADPWTTAEKEHFISRFTRCCQVSLGLQSLSTEGVLAYVEAEDGVNVIDDEQAREMFAMLKSSRPQGWAPILEALGKRVGEKTIDMLADKAVLGAVAGIQGLIAMLS